MNPFCGTVDYSTFTVYFILTSGGAAQASANQAIQADTIGPPAIADVSVDQGDTRLHVTWAAVGTTTDEAGTTTSTGTTTASQVAIYYQASNAGGSNADAGTSVVCKDGGFADGGVDDTGDAAPEVAVDGGCTLTPNEATSSCSAPGFLSTGPDSTVPNITLNATTSDAEIDGLTNGVSYAVAVVAQDLFLNPGQISALECQTPIQLNDFFETYRNDGGQAGGGCGVYRVGNDAGSAALGVVAFSFMLTMIRRRITRPKPSASASAKKQDKK